MAASEQKTYAAARNLALAAAKARMAAAGRAKPDRSDERFIRQEASRLLWHVPADRGGFDGLDDSQLEKRAGEYFLPFEMVTEALWSKGQWPQAEMAVAA